MKYFIMFLLSLVVFLIIFTSLGYLESDLWFLFIYGFQWVTEFILPWVIVFLLIFIAKNMVNGKE